MLYVDNFDEVSSKLASKLADVYSLEEERGVNVACEPKFRERRTGCKWTVTI